MNIGREIHMITGSRWLAAAAAMALCGIAAPASATLLVYKATDYMGGSHGLWTNDLNTGTAKFYSFQNDMLFKIDTNTGIATLTGTAKNDLNTVAVLNLTFTTPLDALGASGFVYKQESGVAYNAATDSPDIDFFTGGSGTITIGATNYALQADPFAGNTVFQYGTGANAKNASEYGGSAWLLVNGRSHHWDINFALTAVPEPATWAMLVLGFGAIGGGLRRTIAAGRSRASRAIA